MFRFHISFSFKWIALAVMLWSITACSLSSAPSTDEVIASATPWVTTQPVFTSTPRPTNTAQPTATSTRVVSNNPVPQQPALYNVRQPLPAPICGVYPSSGINAVNVRSGPSTGFPAIGILPAGHWARARHVDNTGVWYQINVPNTPVDGGWVSDTVVDIQTPCNCGVATSCEPITQPPQTAAPPTQPNPQITVTPPAPQGVCVAHVAIQGGVPIYNQPTTDAGEWGLLSYGEYVPVTGRGIGGTWFAVGVNTGIVPEPGLFGMRWLRNDGTVMLSGPCGALPVFNYEYAPVQHSCVLNVNEGAGDVPVYRYPSELTGQWGNMSEIISIPLIGQTQDGWYAFDPAVAQAANVGIWRLRWVRTDAAVHVTGCDSVPYISYTG